MRDRPTREEDAIATVVFSFIIIAIWIAFGYAVYAAVAFVADLVR